MPADRESADRYLPRHSGDVVSEDFFSTEVQPRPRAGRYADGVAGVRGDQGLVEHHLPHGVLDTSRCGRDSGRRSTSSCDNHAQLFPAEFVDLIYTLVDFTELVVQLNQAFLIHRLVAA